MKSDLISFFDCCCPAWRELAKNNPFDKFVLVAAHDIESFLSQPLLDKEDYKGLDEFLNKSYIKRTHARFPDWKDHVPSNNPEIRKVAKELYDEVT